MFRKVTIALLATAALAMLAPDVVSARGGGGGMHGGGGYGGMHGGFGGGVSHGVAALVEAVLTTPDLMAAVSAARRIVAADSRPEFRAGLIAGARRTAERTTTRNGQRTKVQCITSDCNLWRSWTE